MLICGIPMLYMELVIGQFTRRGPIGAFAKLCPLFKGVGIASVAISFFLSTYYNVIISYALFYLFSSFRSQPPWDSCGNRWNTPQCWRSSMATIHNKTKPPFSQSPAEEFYTKKVLQATSGVDEVGEMRWELMVCLFILWIIVYFSLWKSVRSSGRVLYFTATVPFFLVLLFLGHSLSLNGAEFGMRYLFMHPNWQLLLDSKVWVNAAAQNLNSLGVAYGCVISFSSYNRYNNNPLHDTLIISAINAIASMLVAVLAFSTIGNIAWEQGKPIEDVVNDGPGLAFVVYPEALAKMPFMGFWSVLFFFTLFCLGLNNQFAIVEVIVTSIVDGFPKWVKRKLVCHEMLVLVICLISLLGGLPHVSQGGIFYFQLMDYYVASLTIIIVACVEVIAIGWFFGAGRLSNCVQKMTGRQAPLYFLYCWKVAAPLLLLCVWLFSLVDFEQLSYDNERYTYPIWAQLFGWLVTLGILSSIPITAVRVYCYSQEENVMTTFPQKLLNTLKSPKNGDDEGQEEARKRYRRRRRRHQRPESQHGAEETQAHAYNKSNSISSIDNRNDLCKTKTCQAKANNEIAATLELESSNSSASESGGQNIVKDSNFISQDVPGEPVPKVS